MKKLLCLFLLAICAPMGGQVHAAETNTLTFAECVSHALTSNLSVREQQLQWLISKWSLRREYFAFEPALTVSATHRNNERENNVEESLSQLSPFFEERNWEYSAAVEGAVPIGGRFRLGYSLTDISNNLTNGTFDAEFDNEYSSFAGVNYTQPLLQGAGRTATLARLRLAASQSDTDLQELRRQVMSIVSLAGASYWNLVMAQDELRIRQESIGIAERILADNEARVDAGKMSDLEVFQAKAGVALRRTRANDAQQAWIEAISDLKQIFADSSAAMILAEDAPRLLEIKGDFVTSMDQATRLNPDYLKARLEIDQEDIRLKFAKNQKWPQLDLEGSYGFNGLGDTPGESFEDVEGQDFDSWTVGVVLRLGLGGGGQGDSELAAALLRKQQALLRLKNTEVSLSNGIISSINRVKALKGSIENYKIVTDYNQRLLAVELSKLEQGKSDSRKVLEIEEELFESKSAELSSMIDYQMARLALQVARGSILHDYGLDILDAGDPKQSALIAEKSRDTDVQWPLKEVTTTPEAATLTDTVGLRKKLLHTRTNPLKQMFDHGVFTLKLPSLKPEGKPAPKKKSSAKSIKEFLGLKKKPRDSQTKPPAATKPPPAATTRPAATTPIRKRSEKPKPQTKSVDAKPSNPVKRPAPPRVNPPKGSPPEKTLEVNPDLQARLRAAREKAAAAKLSAPKKAKPAPAKPVQIPDTGKAKAKPAPPVKPVIVVPKQAKPKSPPVIVTRPAAKPTIKPTPPPLSSELDARPPILDAPKKGTLKLKQN